MARSQQTFNKKEREKKRRKKAENKREEKEKRKLEKAEKGTIPFEEQLMYVDEDGNFTTTPPDPAKKKKEINLEDILLGAAPIEVDKSDPIKQGKVKFFNHDKGYGFINDHGSGDSIFVHINNAEGELHEGDKVQFEIEMGQKGPTAVRVKVIT